ncbi:MAG: cytochrome c [Gemmatimonadaceae bacterium]|nr:cytochrome c [Gemmatimonadaceae bacterium]
MTASVTRSLLLGAGLCGAVALLGLSDRPAVAAEAPAVHAVAPLPPVNKYAEVCAVCHQATGQGLPGAFPPLAGSEWLNGRPDIPIAIVLHGLQGEITVKGAKFNSAMMPWGGVLNDEDLAATLTYARSQWGNRAAPITAAQVRATRARFASRTTPWTAAELRAIR